MKNRDIIIVYCNVDTAYVTLNGHLIKDGYIESGPEAGWVFDILFKQLNFNTKPIYVSIFDEDYLGTEEIEDFWRVYNRDTKCMFTEQELDVLYETEDAKSFMIKVKERLEREHDAYVSGISS